MILWFLVINVVLMLKYSEGKSCQLGDVPKLTSIVKSPYNYTHVGEIYHLVGFFPAKLKSRYNRSGFVWIEAAKFAFLELLKYYHDSGLQINIDFLIFDSCNQIDIGTAHLLNLILQTADESTVTRCCNSKLTNNIIGIIGPASSSITNHFLNTLSSDLYPVISYSATSVRFDDKTHYPTFLRTIPPDNLQAKMMMDILLHYNWTYVTVVAQDNDYGRMGMDELRKLLVENKVCTSLESVYNPNDNESIKKVLEHLQKDVLSNVVVLWASGPAIQTFLQASGNVGLFNKVFVLSESANENKNILHYDPRIAQGVLSIVPDGGIYDSFEENFRKMSYTEHADTNPWLKYFFENYIDVNKSLSNETIIEDLWKKLPMTKNGNVYNAMFAYGKAIKNFVESNPASCRNTSSCLKEIVQDRIGFFNSYLRTVVFDDLHGHATSFDTQGNQNSTRFLLSTPQPIHGRLEWRRVGAWNKNLGLHIFESFHWANNQTTVPKSRCGNTCLPGFSQQTGSKECCWRCIPCQENEIKTSIGKGQCTKCPKGTYSNKQHTKCEQLRWVYINYKYVNGIILLTFASINVVTTVLITIIFIVYRKTPVVISSQKTMTSMQLFFLGAFNFVTFLTFGKVDRHKCLLYGIITPFMSILAVSPTIIKTQRITTVFKANIVLNKRRYVMYKDLMKIFILMLIQSAIIIISNVFSSIGETSTSIDQKTMEIQSSCSLKVIYFMQTIYLLIIFTLCGIAAFRARGLPTNYNETRVTAHAMFICSIIIIFTFPLYLSISDDITRLMINNITILLIDFIILVFMYLPKIFVILFRPNLNTIMHFQMARMAKISRDVSISYYRRGLNIKSKGNRKTKNHIVSNDTTHGGNSPPETPKTSRSMLDINDSSPSNQAPRILTPRHLSGDNTSNNLVPSHISNKKTPTPTNSQRTIDISSDNSTVRASQNGDTKLSFENSSINDPYNNQSTSKAENICNEQFDTKL